MSDIDCAVEFVDVRAGYRGRNVLRGVCLRIAAGEITGIYGPNGSGKTTLLRAIQALIPIASGRASVCGLELIKANYRAIRRQTACVFQTPAVDRRLPVSAFEVAMMGRYARIGLLRRPSVEDRRVVKGCLERVGAAHLAHRPYGQLSGGEQQRVNLARALAQEPRLLLLDEPTTFLDVPARQRVLKIIREIHSYDRLTTVIVSHDSGALTEVCSKIAVIRDGTVERVVSPQEFTCA